MATCGILGHRFPRGGLSALPEQDEWIWVAGMIIAEWLLGYGVSYFRAWMSIGASWHSVDFQLHFQSAGFLGCCTHGLGCLSQRKHTTDEAA